MNYRYIASIGFMVSASVLMIMGASGDNNDAMTSVLGCVMVVTGFWSSVLLLRNK